MSILIKLLTYIIKLDTLAIMNYYLANTEECVEKSAEKEV